MQAFVHPVCAEGGSRIRRDVLERDGVCRRRVDDDGVVERAVVPQSLNHLGDGRRLLSDRDVDAAHLLLRITARPVVPLGDDCVDRDRRLPRLPVADDELALAAADRRHRVDRRDARLQRLLHRLPVDDVRRLHLEVAASLRRDRAHAVDWVAERVDDTPQESVAHGDRQDLMRLLDEVALLDVLGLAQHDTADLVLVQVEREPEDTAGELEQLVSHRVWKALDARDPVAGLDDAPDLLPLDRGLPTLDVPSKSLGDLTRIEFRFRYHVVTSSPLHQQVLFGFFQSGPNGPVENLVPHPRDDAADHGRVDDHSDLDLASRSLRQRLLQAFALRLVERHRRANLGQGALPSLRHHLRERVDDAPSLACSPLLDQERQQVQGDRVDAVTDRVADQVALVLDRQRRIDERLAEPSLLLEHLRHLTAELLEDAVAFGTDLALRARDGRLRLLLGTLL